jgi:hypothetical protein
MVFSIVTTKKRSRCSQDRFGMLGMSEVQLESDFISENAGPFESGFTT